MEKKGLTANKGEEERKGDREGEKNIAINDSEGGK